jgi:hypothetical protein
MSFLSGLVSTIVGGLEIAAGVLIEVGTLGGGTALAVMLIASGAGMVISGIGSMIAGNGPTTGYVSATRNSIAPWKIQYGEGRVGGTVVYMNEWGLDNQMLDMVVVLAAHPCQSVDAVFFDQQRLHIDPTAIPTSAKAGHSIPTPATGSGTSFNPPATHTNIVEISRSVHGVVTVHLLADIPYLEAGDQAVIVNVPKTSGLNIGDETLNGTFQVSQIISRISGSLTFTYLNGGVPITINSSTYSGFPFAGSSHAAEGQSKWPTYGRSVYIEPMLGNQSLGDTFVGMTAGTPYDGTGVLVTPESPHNARPSDLEVQNPWTAYCSLQGKTAVFIRIRYLPPDGVKTTFYPSGMPQISFHVTGKNNIWDPRTSTYGYTTNSALCIADYLSNGSLTADANKAYGFKAAYGTEIPTAPLIAAANICDVPITLAKGGTEPQFACNGSFELNMRRGEILQNLLTSCGGRITYYEGQFIIWPASWITPITPVIDLQAIAAGNPRWKPTVSIKDLYNGCKGTYIAPDNHWQSTDFPRYAQDTDHGYSGPSIYNGDINMALDNGERRWLDIQLPFTISYATAQRLAKIELLRRRHRGTGTFICNMFAYQFTPMDIIEVNNSIFGWSAKQLEISAVRLRTDKQSTDSGQEAIVLKTELDVQEIDSSIYDWTPSQEELTPQGYIQSLLPTNTVQETICYPWSPGYVSPLAGDAIVPYLPANFGIQPVYGTDASLSGTAALKIIGTPPINALDTEIFGPRITCTANTTGGSLIAGSYVVGLSAWDSGATDHANTQFLDYGIATTTGTTGSITVNIEWSSGNDGGDLYVGFWPAGWPSSSDFVFHHNGTISSGSSSVTITNFDQTTPGGPDPIFDHYAVTWSREYHSGCFAEQIQAVTTTTITIADAPGGSTAANLWAGYTLSLLAKEDSTVEVPVLNMPVLSNTASSGSPSEFTLTIGPNALSVQLPDLTTLLAVGDLVTMRTKPTFTATSFSDVNIANGFAPSGATGIEAGHVAYVLTGPDKGDSQTISSVGLDGSLHSTIFNLAGSWVITPNTGDIVVICDSAKAPEVLSGPISVINAGALVGSPVTTSVAATPNITNLANSVWLFLVRTCDVNGNFGDDWMAPVREVYMFGAMGSGLLNPGYFDLTPAANITIDLANGLNQRLVLSSTAVTFLAPIFTGSTIMNGQSFTLYLDQDVTGARATPTFTGGADGFASDTGSDPVAPDASTRTSIIFTFHPGDIWIADSFRTGLATS